MFVYHLLEYITEGLIGTAAVLILPAAVLYVSEVWERRQARREGGDATMENHLRNDILDRIIRRS